MISGRIRKFAAIKYAIVPQNLAMAKTRQGPCLNFVTLELLSKGTLDLKFINANFLKNSVFKLSQQINLNGNFYVSAVSL